MASVLANYHTHTPRCHHATGNEEEYIATALRSGYQILGFSDHAPWPYGGGFVSNCRMLPAQLEGYVSTVRALAQRYAGQLRILCGLEAEYIPAHMDWLREQIACYSLDYVILGNHFDRSEVTGLYFGACTKPEDLEAYADTAIEAMSTGIYCCLAHPDLCFSRYPQFDAAAEKSMRRVCAAAARLNIPLEYNLLGETRRLTEDHTQDLGYTTPQFWRIAAEYPVRAIIGCDAHTPAGLGHAAHIREVAAQLRGMGITVLDTLPGLE